MRVVIWIVKQFFWRNMTQMIIWFKYFIRLNFTYIKIEVWRQLNGAYLFWTNLFVFFSWIFFWSWFTIGSKEQMIFLFLLFSLRAHFILFIWEPYMSIILRSAWRIRLIKIIILLSSFSLLLKSLIYRCHIFTMHRC